MMPEMDRETELALTLGALAQEMNPRFEMVEAALIFEAAQSWPLGDIMPVKRETDTASGGVIETGFIRRGDGPLVIVAGMMPVYYASFDAVAADGWRPD
jgi:hypothetical protein